jgi:hypothetical protein
MYLYTPDPHWIRIRHPPRSAEAATGETESVDKKARKPELEPDRSNRQRHRRAARAGAAYIYQFVG